MSGEVGLSDRELAKLLVVAVRQYRVARRELVARTDGRKRGQHLWAQLRRRLYQQVDALLDLVDVGEASR